MSNSTGSSGFGRFLRYCFFLGFGLVVFVAVVGLIGRGIFLHRTEREWAQAVADVEAIDPNWRWEQIEAERTKIPDEQNAGLVIARLLDSKLLPESHQFKPQIDGKLKSGIPDEPIAAEPLPMPDELDEHSLLEIVADLPPEARLPLRTAHDIERELCQFTPALTEALKIADMPQGRHPIDMKPDFISTVLPTVQFSRLVAQLLALETVRAAEQGDAAAAMRGLRALINTGRSMGDEPLLLVQLTRMAIDAISINHLERVLAQVEAPDKELAKLQQLFEDEANASRLIPALRGERAAMSDLCEQMIQGKIDLQKMAGITRGAGNSPVDAMTNLAGPMLARQARPEMLRLYTELIDIVHRPVNEWESSFKSVEQRIAQGTPLTRQILPATSVTGIAEARTRTTLRCATTAIAAERFRRTHQRWPNSLRELVNGGLLPEVPLDPYTGEPLHLAPRPYGMIIYSVGPDAKDDGGLRVPSARPGFPHDFVFRLYDPKLRRMQLEPLPVKPREMQEISHERHE